MLLVYLLPGINHSQAANILAAQGYGVHGSPDLPDIEGVEVLPDISSSRLGLLADNDSATAVLLTERSAGQIRELMTERNDVRLLAMHVPLSRFLVEGDMDITGVQSSAESWGESVETLLSLLHEFRRYSLVVDGEQAAASIKRFRKHLYELHPEGPAREVQDDDLPVEPIEKVAPIRHLMARNLVYGDPALAELEAELHARTIRLTSTTPPANEIGEALEELARLESATKKLNIVELESRQYRDELDKALQELARLESATKELRLAELENRQLRNELDDALITSEKLETKLKSSEVEATRLLVDLSSKNATCKDLYKERHALASRLAELEKDLSEKNGICKELYKAKHVLETRISKQDEQLRSVGAESHDASRQLHLIRKSFSWKITSPLRWVSRLFRPRRKAGA